MKSPILEIQKAVVAKLTGLGYIVYDLLPEGDVPYPFIVVGDELLLDLPIKVDNRTALTLPLYIWSDTNTVESKTIADITLQNFVDLEPTFALTGFTVDMCELDSIRTNRQFDKNKQLIQTIITFRFEITES